MPADPIQNTEFLVLRKTPYSESSLVVAGISPDYGQLHFLAHGARRLAKRQYPLVDLFRILEIKFRPSTRPEALERWQSAELGANFDAIAGSLPAFEAAAWLSRFALGNLIGRLPCPDFYQAITGALRLLSTAAARTAGPEIACHAAVTGVSLAYLQENGLLSDYSGNPVTAQRCSSVIAGVCGERAMPGFSIAQWRSMHDWTLRLLRRADCNLPS